MNHIIEIKQNGRAVFQVTIPLTDGTAYTDFEWDSKTGIISAVVNGTRKALPYLGNGCGALEPGSFEINGASYRNMDYHYWYY